jgi:ankyrin repeat protein
VSRKKFPDQQQQQLHHILASSPAAIDLRFEALGIQTRDGSYPLHMAVSNRSSLEVIELLITAAPEVVHLINKYGETPLHLALRGRVAEEKVIEMLLDADDNALALEMPERFCGNLPLHLAVVDGASLSIVVQLLTRFPHAVRVPNTDGDLPISLARGDEDLMDLLVVSDLADDLDDVETAASKMTDFDDEITDVDVDIVEVQSSVCSEDSSAG